MKLLLLKTLLQRRVRDEGFTLPMVIALGLVMLLLGTINIVKSSEENIAAINQNSSSDALAVAEVGVTKYRELLNQNRILTIYNQAQWTANADVSGQTCTNILTTPTGWKDGGTAAAPNSITKWWKVEENIDGAAGDDLLGEYRLVSYVYDIDNNLTTNNNGQFAPNDDNANTTDSFTFNDTTYNPTTGNGYKTRGILTVQGRSTDGSEAQIQVEIPLRINDLENFAPVLWVKSGEIATPGTLNIPNADDNIVLKSPAGTECATPAAIAGNSNVISDARNLPAIIPDPSGTPGIATDKKNIISSIDTTGAKITLPRLLATSDNKTSNDDKGRFLYEVTNINVANNNLETDGIAKVTLYTANDIDISSSDGNTVTIGNNNAANPNGSYANFNSGSTSNTSVSSANLEIYVAGSKTITIQTNTSGTVNIEGFIHAPDAILDIKGSGTVNINGAMWVKEFKNTATVNIRSDKTSTKTGSEASYKFYTTTATITPRPLTSSPTNWVREEVQ